MLRLTLEQNAILKILIFSLRMVLSMNAMWLLMASDGQFGAKGVEVAAKVLKFKFHTLAMGKDSKYN